MTWDRMMSGFGLLATLLWVVFAIALLVLVVLAVLWLARSLSSDRGPAGASPGTGAVGASPGTGAAGPSPGTGRAGAAREALDLRYARGEIGREEYLQARRDLGDPGD